MVVVHHLHYPRLLVFCRSVVVPTVALPAWTLPRLVMLCYSYLVCTHIIYHIFAVVILRMFRAGPRAKM